jgi:sulfotransferase family protein
MNRLHPGPGALEGDMRLSVLDLDGPALMDEARRRTRLDDFAEDETFDAGFPLLIRSYETESHLNFIGRVFARQNTLRLLTNRLRLVDDRRRHPGIADEEVRRPLFLTGIAGSGGTYLHELLAQDPDNRAPLHWQAVLPSPPPDDRSGAANRRIAAADGQLRWLARLQPGIKRLRHLGARLPEECGLVASHCFASFAFQEPHDVPTYETWLEDRDLTRCYVWHRAVLQHLQLRGRRGRWVLSAPGHLFGLAALFATYPDASVVFVHRDPVEAIRAVARLTVVHRRTFSPTVDPSAVAREVTERWATAIARACRYRDAGIVPAGRFLDVRYDDLLGDPIGTIGRIYAHWDAPLTGAAMDGMRRFVASPSRACHSPESAVDPEWVDERYRWYRERFAVASRRFEWQSSSEC